MLAENIFFRQKNDDIDLFFRLKTSFRIGSSFFSTSINGHFQEPKLEVPTHI